MSNSEDEFYVGYMPTAPPKTAGFLKTRILILLAVIALLGVMIPVAQGVFAPAVFEFGTFRTFEGVIVEKPYPMLRLTRPGLAGSAAENSRYYLVAFGKFGAQQAVAGLDGKRVRLEGSLIYREDQTMLELADKDIEVINTESDNPGAQKDLGQQTMVGEIVDSKCFLGVMNPGELKTHKACAIRCISGGIPPVFLVRAENGDTRYFLLVDGNGAQVNDRVLDMVADPLKITGRVVQNGDIYILKANPETFERL